MNLRSVIAVIIALGLCAAAAVPVVTPSLPPGVVPYTSVVDNVPAAWPCKQTIYVNTNTTYAPAGALDDITSVVGQLGQLSGLHLQIIEPTSVMPKSSNLDRQRDANITIAYGHSTTDGGNPAAATDMLDDSSLEMGKTNLITAYTRGLGHLVRPRNVITSADVVIRDSGYGNLGGKSGTEIIILHEMLHALGLGHAKQSADSVMTPVVRPELLNLQADDIDAVHALYRCQH